MTRARIVVSRLTLFALVGVLAIVPVGILHSGTSTVALVTTPVNMVTTDTAQTVAGAKTFSAGITTSSVSASADLDLNSYGSNKMRLGNGAITTYVGVAIGQGTAIVKHMSTSATIDFDSVATGATNFKTTPLTGAAAGDTVTVTPPAAIIEAADVHFQCWVTASNSIGCRIYNIGAPNPFDAASGSYRIDVWQH